MRPAAPPRSVQLKPQKVPQPATGLGPGVKAALRGFGHVTVAEAAYWSARALSETSRRLAPSTPGGRIELSRLRGSERAARISEVHQELHHAFEPIAQALTARLRSRLESPAPVSEWRREGQEPTVEFIGATSVFRFARRLRYRPTLHKVMKQRVVSAQPVRSEVAVVDNAAPFRQFFGNSSKEAGTDRANPLDIQVTVGPRGT
ncbi:MAG: hypothetical protein AAFQ82_14215, partial [Myxococcota bacterium]